MTDEPGQTRAAPELRGPARIVVAALAAAPIVIGLPGVIGELFAIPFGVVGGLLAIRRPRMSIGWLLLLVAYGFALVSLPVDATAAQFRDGSVDALSIAVVGLGTLLSGGSFLALAALAIVFPSGRLPVGRWGTLARIGLAAGAALAVASAVMPEANVTLVGDPVAIRVPNPLAVLPDLPLWQVVTPDTAILPLVAILAAGAVSLAVRFRRSADVERQQLRWLGAALILVVLAVVLGLVVSAVVPGAGDSGLAWIPAMLAFPGIPVSILIAVLRYRLYEIDTLINRALVYGLLTAILAGGSSATIGVVEKVFVGALGPGSDTTIVFTTIVVVAAFDPLKKRLQAFVDRRFKETHGPAATLAAFVAAVHASLGRPETDRTVRQLAGVVAQAYRAPSVAVELTRGTDRHAATVEPPDGPAGAADPLVATAEFGGARLTVRVTGGDTSAEVSALQPALLAILGELTA